MKKKTDTQKSLADRLGVTPIHLNAVLKGRKMASIRLAIRIEKASKGKYKAADLRPELRELK